MDTVAIDEDANPVIVEYQWDMVDGRALGQVFGTTTGFSAAAVGSTRELRPVMALRSWSIGDDLA